MQRRSDGTIEILRGFISLGILLGVLVAFSQGCSDSSGGPCSPDYSGYPACDICSRPECCRDGVVDPVCEYPGNVQDNTNKDAITIGGSVVWGAYCFQWGSAGVSPRCGYIPCLEELTGMEIANFGQQGLSAASQVRGLKKFERVDISVAVNPNARRVYLLMGGNDILLDLLQSVFRTPRPGNNCRLSDKLMRHLRDTVDDMRLVVERYRFYHGIPEVVVASQPAAEIESDAPKSCKTLSKRLCSDCYLCLNQVLETWSTMVRDMVDSLGGADNGIFFADLFDAFPKDAAECSLFCDCVHPNCTGMQIVAETFNEAVP